MYFFPNTTCPTGHHDSFMATVALEHTGVTVRTCVMALQIYYAHPGLSGFKHCSLFVICMLR